jgi:hypothetical protein
MQRVTLLGLVVLPAALACAEDPPPPPPPPPTIWNPTVTDAVTGAPIAGARVQTAGLWKETGADGTLSLELEPGPFQYRVEARGYLPIPARFTESPTVTIILEQTVKTAIELLPSARPQGPGSISGKVQLAGAPVSGALVVATAAVLGSAITDDEGSYLITGLNAGEYRVVAIKAGHTGAVRDRVTVTAATEGIDLTIAAGAAGSVKGTITGGDTRVWLAHADLGDPIPGLDVQSSGGSYVIAGVPDGRYEVRAGLELDGRTLDPDPINEDGPIEVTVAGAEVTQNLVLKSAIGGLMPTDTASAALVPSFDWSDVANADFYVIEVYDADGTSLMGGFDAAGNPRTRVLQKPVAYSGRTLTPGARYTWRVWAGENDNVIPSEFTLPAASEELGGWFDVRK